MHVARSWNRVGRGTRNDGKWRNPHDTPICIHPPRQKNCSLVHFTFFLFFACVDAVCICWHKEVLLIICYLFHVLSCIVFVSVCKQKETQLTVFKKKKTNQTITPKATIQYKCCTRENPHANIHTLNPWSRNNFWFKFESTKVALKIWTLYVCASKFKLSWNQVRCILKLFSA